ncbi:MAG: DUF92 domain-containing protein, partial [Bacteroidota bacterium]
MPSDLLSLLPLGILVLVTSLACEWSARSHWLPYWLSRKVLHFIAVGACAWAPFLVESLWSLVAIVCPAWVVLLWLVSSRKLMVDEEGRRAWGIVWFPLAYLVLLLSAGQDKSIVVFPMAVLAVCDPAATIAGTLFARKQYNLTGDEKSLVGNTVFFFSFLVLCALFFKTPLIPEPFSSVWAYLPLMGMVLAAVEALGSRGLDNLYIPLVAAAIWQRLTVAGPMAPVLHLYTVALLALLFLWLMYKRSSLTADGSVGAWLLAVGIVWFGHWTLLLPILLFFSSSILIGKLFPSQLPSDYKSGKGRDVVQVYANGGIYLMLIFLVFPSGPGVLVTSGSSGQMIQTPIFDYQVIKTSQLGEVWYRICTSAGGYIEGSGWNTLAVTDQPFSLAPYFSGMLIVPLAVMAVANSDTWSSEVGRYVKGRTYDIVRFRRVEPGLSGGISLAGTLAGGLGAGLIGSLAFFISDEWITGFLVFAVIGFFGFMGML